jgi:hypothetical protein
MEITVKALINACLTQNRGVAEKYRVRFYFALPINADGYLIKMFSKGKS